MIEHEDADLSGSRFRNVDLSGSTIRDAFMHGVTITGAYLVHSRIDGHIESLQINGVDVGPFVEAELDRRHPERLDLRARDVAGLRRAWASSIERTATLVERAQRLPDGAVYEKVDDEYSFVETLRHLVFAADRWLTGPVFDDPAPYFHPWGRTHDGAEEGPADGLDPEAAPTLDEIVAVRNEYLQRGADLLATATAADLDRTVASPNGGDTTVGDCIRVVLGEEWWHHRYAERDLEILESR